MNDDAYRTRAERGEVQMGTWITMIRTPGQREMRALGATIINYSSDAAVLRAGYPSVVDEVRRLRG